MITVINRHYGLFTYLGHDFPKNEAIKLTQEQFDKCMANPQFAWHVDESEMFEVKRSSEGKKNGHSNKSNNKQKGESQSEDKG